MLMSSFIEKQEALKKLQEIEKQIDFLEQQLTQNIDKEIHRTKQAVSSFIENGEEKMNEFEKMFAEGKFGRSLRKKVV
jgi:ferritin-like metal-binding protein YciE